MQEYDSTQTLSRRSLLSSSMVAAVTLSATAQQIAAAPSGR